MAHLKMTALQAATIRGARDAADYKAIKRDVIASLRSSLGIPADVKLILLVDPSDSPFLGILQKGTRYPLLAGADGRYAGIDVPRPAAPVTPPVADNPRFSVAGPGSGVFKVSAVDVRDVLQELLGDGTAVSATLPDGAPAMTVGQYLLDNQTGDLYFRV